jgi:serine/threonine protein kinase
MPSSADYRLQRILFQHGRTTVYLAHHHGQPVVLKRTELSGIPLDARKLAVQEAHLLSRLKHPNIIKCPDYFEEADAIVIVMEWAELGTKS